MSQPLILGAVAYDPKVVTIWESFKDYFAGHGFAFDYVLYSNYESQVLGHFGGQCHVAWNSPLAWNEAERLAALRGRAAAALALGGLGGWLGWQSRSRWHRCRAADAITVAGLSRSLQGVGGFTDRRTGASGCRACGARSGGSCREVPVKSEPVQQFQIGDVVFRARIDNTEIDDRGRWIHFGI